MSFLDRTGHNLLGVGVYTLQQAARLVRLPLQTVERITGPEPDPQTPLRSYPIAVLTFDLTDDQKAVSFASLIELYVAATLNGHGVRWPAIRIAAKHAHQVLRVSNPLTSAQFRSGSRRVFMSMQEAGRKSELVIDLLHRQQAFLEIIKQTLSPDIVVRDPLGELLSWSPLGRARRVVLDPKRRFGEPIDPKSGVPTSALARAYHDEGDNFTAAAHWFDVDTAAVRDAVRFEKWLTQS